MLEGSNLCFHFPDQAQAEHISQVRMTFILCASERKWSGRKEAGGNKGLTTERADDFLLFITRATLMNDGVGGGGGDKLD